MKKIAGKILTDLQVLTALGQDDGQFSPNYPTKELKKYRLRYRTIKRFVVVTKQPGDVQEFAIAMKIIPGKDDDVELVPNATLYREYFEFSSARNVEKNNPTHFGREMQRLGLTKIRRTLHGKKIIFRIVRKGNCLPKALITNLEGDNEKRQNRSIYRATVSWKQKGTCTG